MVDTISHLTMLIHQASCKVHNPSIIISCKSLLCAICMQGQIVGSIIFASNATSAAAAVAAATITAASSGAYNQLLVTSTTTALNAWMNSSSAAAILNSTSYAGVTIPSGFSTTLLTVTNVVVINATVASATVESLLGITSSSVHYALEVWLNITVQVGYDIAAISTATSRRRLLQQPSDGSDQLLGDSSALAMYDRSITEHRPGVGQGLSQLGFGKPLLGKNSGTDAATAKPALLPLGFDQGFGSGMHEARVLPSASLTGDLDAQLRALTRAAVGQPRRGGRRLQQYLSSFWLSPLDLQLAMLKSAFAQTAQCNATAVALQLGTTSSLSSLDCASSSTITLLTDLLAASTSASNPALSVLKVSTAPQGSRSTTAVDSSSGIEASLASGLSILLHGYEVQIAEMLAMTVKAINTVDTLGSRMAGTYINAFIKAAQNYITATTKLVNSALAIFDKTLSSTAVSVRISAYTQLVQTSLAAARQAQNDLQASPSFQAAVAALAPNCSTSRDSLGNAQFVFLLAANQSSESFANSSDKLSVAAAAQVLNETASDCPLQLRQRATGYCMSRWNGYPVAQVSSMPDRQAVGEQVVGRRRTVGIDGNVVVGGLLLHQVKTPGLSKVALSSSIILDGHILKIADSQCRRPVAKQVCLVLLLHLKAWLA